MAEVLDLKRAYRELDLGSDPAASGADFIEQHGVIFAWSESNTRYERAWWLYDDAADCGLVRHLRATRAPAGVALPLRAGSGGN